MRVGAKLVALISLLIGAFALVVSWFVPAFLEKVEVAAMTERTDALCRMLAYSVSPTLVFDDVAAAQEALRAVRGEPQIVTAAVARADGRPFAELAIPEAKDLKVDARATPRLDAAGLTYSSDSPVLHNGRLVGRVTLTVSLASVRADAERGRRFVAGLGLLAALLGITAAYGISTLVTRPLIRLARTAEEITAGGTGTRTDVVSSDEIGVLATAFNRMVDRLESAYQELEVTNRELESRVEARTQELRRQVAQTREAEAAHRASEERYRSLFEEDISGGVLVEPDGRILACNSAFARIFAFTSSDEALRVSFFDLFPTEAARQAWLDLVTSQRRVQNQEIDLRRRDGTPVTALGNFVGTFDPEGRLETVKGYLFDMTERRSLELQLRQAQKMEAVGRLAGGVAHDFNNLLTAILGFADLLAGQVEPGSDMEAFVKEIQKGGERAASLTKQLLAFSRRQVLEPSVLDVNAVVAGMETMLRRLIGEDIQLVTQLAPDAGRARADAGQLEQVILNLSVNARDAMPKGGRLLLETQNVELDLTFTRRNFAIVPGQYVLLAVSDSGAGMDAETRSHLFEPFFTTKERGKGTGLGLATVYGIVKQSGGYIWAYSEPGTGSTFKIYLPRVEEDLEAPQPSSSRSVASHRGETLMLVEDEPAVRSIARQALEQLGYKVLEAGDGVEALELARRQANPAALLITDVVMPRMSGPELARALRALWPGVAVLFMSGYTDPERVGFDLLQSGATFLQKPFNSFALARKVQEVLELA